MLKFKKTSVLIFICIVNFCFAYSQSTEKTSYISFLKNVEKYKYDNYENGFYTNYKYFENIITSKSDTICSYYLEGIKFNSFTPDETEVYYNNNSLKIHEKSNPYFTLPMFQLQNGGNVLKNTLTFLQSIPFQFINEKEAYSHVCPERKYKKNIMRNVENIKDTVYNGKRYDLINRVVTTNYEATSSGFFSNFIEIKNQKIICDIELNVIFVYLSDVTYIDKETQKEFKIQGKEEYEYSNSKLYLSKFEMITPRYESFDFCGFNSKDLYTHIEIENNIITKKEYHKTKNNLYELENVFLSDLIKK